jgi:hypothetical protein
MLIMVMRSVAGLLVLRLLVLRRIVLSLARAAVVWRLGVWRTLMVLRGARGVVRVAIVLISAAVGLVLRGSLMVGLVGRRVVLLRLRVLRLGVVRRVGVVVLLAAVAVAEALLLVVVILRRHDV